MLRLMVLGVSATCLIAQPDPARPAFEVASIRPTGRPPESSTTGWTASHGNFSAKSAWVRGLIAFAHDVRAALVYGGPAWVDTDQYDVIAKAESPDTSLDQLKAMLRTLLEDRFKLVAHREKRELPIYTLTVAKDGPKIREAKDGEKTYISAAGGRRLVCTRINMLGLVITLANTLGAPVHDETGLTGFYDFTLEWSDPLAQGSANNAQQAAGSAPGLFRAVQDQLGLKLTAKKGPADVLIVDHIERPSEN
jgi:uncharacterized protein (TIGR03435 family)